MQNFSGLLVNYAISQAMFELLEACFCAACDCLTWLKVTWIAFASLCALLVLKLGHSFATNSAASSFGRIKLATFGVRLFLLGDIRALSEAIQTLADSGIAADLLKTIPGFQSIAQNFLLSIVTSAAVSPAVPASIPSSSLGPVFSAEPFVAPEQVPKRSPFRFGSTSISKKPAFRNDRSELEA